MRKILKILSTIVICLFVLSIFGWMSVHISQGDKDFGVFKGTVKYMYSFPDMFSKSIDEAQNNALPQTFIKTPEDFRSINKLENDLVVLTSYSDTNNSRTIALMNLKNDSVLYKWTFNKPIEDFKRIWNPLLLPGKNLVFSYAGTSLTRIDSMSNVIWKQDSIWPNHSINLDSNGNIWICAYATGWYATGYYTLNDKTTFFKDEYLVKIDGETGRILFKKSMAELLTENNLSNYLLKSGNIWDPIHINDIQPAIKTTSFYKKDDIFISTKDLSVILHYRPSTNELINLIEGPFVGEHDVDFYNDSCIVFFNNNYYRISNDDYHNPPKDSSELVFAGDLYSQIVCYNFKNKNFSFINDSVFKANKIFSYSEGLIDFYEPNTCFVEQQNSGILWVIKDKEVIYKNVMPSIHKGFHNLPNWTRIIKNYD